MEVICLETKAFYALVEEVVERLMDQKQENPKWISGEEAMELLKISSKTTLQRLRNEGLVRYTQPMKKLVLYDRESLMSYLESNAREIF